MQEKLTKGKGEKKEKSKKHLNIIKEYEIFEVKTIGKILNNRKKL